MLSTATSETQPDSHADGGVPVDRERLEYVTRAVNSPTLLMVGLGTVVFLLELRDMWSGPKGWLTALAKAALLVVFVVAVRRDWIDRYYQKRFGSVEAPKTPKLSRKEAIFTLVLIFLFFFLILVGWPLDHYLKLTSRVMDRVHAMMSDPTQQINLGPSLYWMALFLASLGRRPGRIERQDQCFALSVLIAFAFIAGLAVWHPGVRQSEPWRVLNAGEFGLGLIAWGLFYHIRLTLLLPKRVSEHDDE